MGFFSKLKEKFTTQVDKVSEKVSQVVTQTTEAIKFNKIKMSVFSISLLDYKSRNV